MAPVVPTVPVYPGDGFMFRVLDDAAREGFAAWARENDPPKNDSWSIYHPACRAVWAARGLEPDDVKIARENP